MIENWSDRSQRDRYILIDGMTQDICPGTVADFRWSREFLGVGEDDCIKLFVAAPKLALLRAPDGKPLYLFAFNPYLSSFSTSRRRSMGVYLTKTILRWARTPEGEEFFRDTWVVLDEADVGVSFTGAWVHKMGYTYTDQFRLPTGPNILRFKYTGA